MAVLVVRELAPLGIWTDDMIVVANSMEEQGYEVEVEWDDDRQEYIITGRKGSDRGS